MSARVVVDLGGLERRFSESARSGMQAAFARRVAFDMRGYVPLDEGTLRDSEPLASDYETGTIEWQTPYAQHVHDLPQTSINTTKNPNARSHWPEEAEMERGDSWQEFARKLVSG